jgi:hypothetical protein
MELVFLLRFLNHVECGRKLDSELAANDNVILFIKIYTLSTVNDRK